MLLDKTDIYFLCKDWTSTLVKMAHLYPSSLIYFKCFYGINSLHFKKLHKQQLFSRKKKVGLRYHSRFKWVLSIYATTIFPYERKCVEFKSKIGHQAYLIYQVDDAIIDCTVQLEAFLQNLFNKDTFQDLNSLIGIQNLLDITKHSLCCTHHFANVIQSPWRKISQNSFNNCSIKTHYKT
jgi:hypothetical protein